MSKQNKNRAAAAPANTILLDPLTEASSLLNIYMASQLHALNATEPKITKTHQSLSQIYQTLLPVPVPAPVPGQASHQGPHLQKDHAGSLM